MEQNDHVEGRPKCCGNVGQEEAFRTQIYFWNLTKWTVRARVRVGG